MEALLLLMDVVCMVLLCLAVSRALKHGEKMGLGLFSYIEAKPVLKNKNDVTDKNRSGADHA